METRRITDRDGDYETITFVALITRVSRVIKDGFDERKSHLEEKVTEVTFEASDEVMDALKADNEALMKFVKNLNTTTDEWTTLIKENVDPKVQGWVASVIWYVFSERSQSIKDWQAFDKLWELDRFSNYQSTIEELKAGLEAVGFWDAKCIAEKQSVMTRDNLKKVTSKRFRLKRVASEQSID